MNSLTLDLQKYMKPLKSLNPTRDIGKVTSVRGQIMKGFLPGASLGSVCVVDPLGAQGSFRAEVVGFEGREVLLMPVGEMFGVGLGSKIVLTKSKASMGVGDELLGRVINGLGEPIDGKGALDFADEMPIYSLSVNPLSRPVIKTPLQLGVRAIDSLLTVGQGQRVGIMAGSGVGKSVLLGMMARSTRADVNVIAMIGERGREVKEFLEQNLDEEALKRTVMIVATSDQSPLVRMRGAFIATTISEYFAGKGQNVLLMMDSITRFAMAQREISLSIGEPPSSKGYTPSVFSQLPKLLERAGSFENGGSITGLYSVLVEGDDMDDPIADAVRSIVDGHIVLNRKMAHKGHYPAIDVLQSASRVMYNVVDQNHMAMALKAREILANYNEVEDLINIGAYRPGASPVIDQAVNLIDPLNQFLKQSIDDQSDFEQTQASLASLLGMAAE